MKVYLILGAFLLTILCLGGVYLFQYNNDSLVLQQTDEAGRVVAQDELDQSTIVITRGQKFSLSALREKGFTEEQITLFEGSSVETGGEKYSLVLQSPVSADVVYFYADEYNDKNTYAVNKKTGSIQKIEAVSPQEVMTEKYVFTPIGTIDSKILFVQQISHQDRYPCWNPLVEAYKKQQDGTYYNTEVGRVRVFDIQSSKLTDFIVPKEVYDVELKKVEKCDEASRNRE